MRMKPFYCPLIILLLSCEKKSLPEPEPYDTITTETANGLPENPHLIHGYLYACLEVSRLGGNYYSTGYIAGRFADPERNLMATYDHASDLSAGWNTSNTPNVSVGRISFNGLMFGGTGYTNYNMYTAIDTLQFSAMPIWDVEGNKTFVPFRLTLPRNIPKILNSTPGFTLQVSKGFTVDLVPLVEGYDSAAVMISANNAFPPIYKSTTAAEPVLVFHSAQLGYLKNRVSATITIMGFNYAHKVISNKRYVFELSAKLERIVVIQQ